MNRYILTAVGLLALSGCDGAGGGGDDADLTCEDASLSADGTAAATTPDGSFSADCFDVTLGSETFTVRVYEVELRSDASDVGIQRRILVRADGVTPGTYTFDETTSGRSRADYSPQPSVTVEATSGTITLTERTETRLRGGFSFETASGPVDGTFDVGI